LEASEAAWCDWFENLVAKLCELGAPYQLPPDGVLCTDLDLFVDVPSWLRGKWLRKAKREALLRRRRLHPLAAA